MYVLHARSVTAYCSDITIAYQLDNMYATESDPAVKLHDNVFAWSQTLGHRSQVMIIYPHHHGLPYMCSTSITEEPSAFKIYPTPHDYSETCVPYRQPRPATVFGQRFGEGDGTAQNTTPTMLDFVFRDHRELVYVLLYIWNEGPIPYLHSQLEFRGIDAWKETMGTAKVSWQSLLSFMNSHNQEVVQRSLESSSWPTQWGEHT